MEERKLRVGVLGCGPIAQFVHFEACLKARNTSLYAICDVAEDLRNRMAAIWQPVKTYANYQEMLDDPQLNAVIIAVGDEFHAAMAKKAVQAGKHVLIEKPLSHSLDECLELKESVTKTDVCLQVGHMKRFDPGIEYARNFIENDMGQIVALKAWYGDHLQRYTATDNLQPIPLTSKFAMRANRNKKEQLENYYMLAHGSHLIDTSMFLGGEIGSVLTHFNRVKDIHSWFVDVEFINGALGHLDLTIKLRSDWHEGFHIYGEFGSVFGKTENPWYLKSSDVRCYLESEQAYRSPLGADGFSYRRQLEHFADIILHDTSPKGCTLEEGINTVKAMLAIQKSAVTGKRIYLDQIENGFL